MLPSNLANLLAASPPPLPVLVRSFHRGGSNKSSGFYSCLSDILYSAGPGGLLSCLPPPAFRSLPRLRTCAIRYKTQATVYICARYKEQRLTSEAPCSEPYLLDSLHAAHFYAPHGDILALVATKYINFDFLPSTMLYDSGFYRDFSTTIDVQAYSDFLSTLSMRRNNKIKRIVYLGKNLYFKHRLIFCKGKFHRLIMFSIILS